MPWFNRHALDRSSWVQQCALSMLALDRGLTARDAADLAEALFEAREPEDSSPAIAASRLFKVAIPAFV